MNTAPSRGRTHHKNTGHFRKSTSNSIFATFNVNFEDRRKYIFVLINKRPVKFQFDTASDITLISRSTRELLGKPTLKDTTHVACSASGSKIQLTGELICDVSFKEKNSQVYATLWIHQTWTFLVWILLKNLTFLRFPWTQFLIPAKLILQQILIKILWAYWKLNSTMFFKNAAGRSLREAEVGRVVECGWMIVAGSWGRSSRWLLACTASRTWLVVAMLGQSVTASRYVGQMYNASVVCNSKSLCGLDAALLGQSVTASRYVDCIAGAPWSVDRCWPLYGSYGFVAPNSCAGVSFTVAMALSRQSCAGVSFTGAMALSCQIAVRVCLLR